MPDWSKLVFLVHQISPLEAKKTIEDFLDKEGGVFPLERQQTFHCTIDRDQNLNIKVDIPHFTGEEQPKEVLDGLNEVERIFEFLNLP